MSKLIPFGDRILVKRRVVGEKIGREGLIVAAESTQETSTDIADVVYVPDHTFTDGQLLANATAMVAALTIKVQEDGNAEALKALLMFNSYLKLKTIQKGDVVMIGKYTGTTFNDNRGSGDMTLIRSDDIIAMVVDE